MFAKSSSNFYEDENRGGAFYTLRFVSEINTCLECHHMVERATLHEGAQVASGGPDLNLLI